jgi:phosphoribosylaminoimidazole carboxylase (NCAIR synthetase)
MDIPAIWLSELSNEDSIRQSVEINIVVIRSSDDEFVTFDILFLHNLDGVYNRSMSDNEVPFYEFALSRLLV